VAALAGVPADVIRMARQRLAELERQNLSGAPHDPQLGLFSTDGPAASPADPAAEALREALTALDPDSLSPREALEALYRLRALLD
jgi:DNA mismatch repair protein MutS